jgi:hypothetical protein
MYYNHTPITEGVTEGVRPASFARCLRATNFPPSLYQRTKENIRKITVDN